MTRFILRALTGTPVWLAYILLMTPLILLGFPLVWIATWSNRMSMRDSAEFPGRRVLSFPDWLWLWSNEEDGIDGTASGFWPAQLVGSWAEAKQVLTWSAWRNSVGNARWTRLFGMTVDNTAVIYAGGGQYGLDILQKLNGALLKTGPYFARQGWRCELRFPWNATHFCWIGWRIAQQTTVTKGVGFAFQPWSKL